MRKSVLLCACFLLITLLVGCETYSKKVQHETIRPLVLTEETERLVNSFDSKSNYYEFSTDLKHCTIRIWTIENGEWRSSDVLTSELKLEDQYHVAGVRIGEKMSEFVLMTEGESLTTLGDGFDFEHDSGMTLYMEHEQPIEESKEVPLLGMFAIKEGDNSFPADTLRRFRNVQCDRAFVITATFEK